MKPEETKAEWEASFKAAQTFFDEGKEKEAEEKLAHCAKLSPEMWCGIGMQALNENELDMAIQRFREALHFAKHPRTKSVCLNNIGAALANGGHRKTAYEYFVKAIDVYPSYADAHANKGLCHLWFGEIEKSKECVARALRVDPFHGQSAFTEALVMLTGGDLPAGWDAYEARWRNPSAGIRKLEVPWPEWDGKNCDRVMIYAEQGAGDVIQMLRYAPLMRQSCKHVYIAVQPQLKALCEYTGFFDKVWTPGEQMNDFGSHVAIMSLPRIFRTTLTTIPSPLGYIEAPPLSDQIIPGPGLNVGICWRGSSAFKQNIWRSSHLVQWSEILDVPGITWHSFQVGEGEDEASLFPQVNSYPRPSDYLETAKRMAAIDLIITTCTSVAHLAGAMGIQTWIMLSHAADFRWLLSREDSPWYSSVRLFRQTREFDWTQPMKQITNELRTKSNR